MVRNSSVSVLVVTSNEKVALVRSWVDTDSVEAGSELVGVDLSVSWNIKDVESVSDIEVVLLGKSDLGVFEFLFSIAEILESVNELILIGESKNWLPGWGSSGWGSTTSNWGCVSTSSSVG